MKASGRTPACNLLSAPSMWAPPSLPRQEAVCESVVSPSEPTVHRLEVAQAVRVGPDDPLPWGTIVLLGMQHLLAMFVGTISPALLLGGILKFSQEETAYLVSMALFVSGVGTLIQICRIGPIGSGLLSAQGTSFAFFSYLILTGQEGGLPLMLGMSLALAPVGLLLGPGLPKLQTAFAPVVSGTVVLLIGLSLIPVAMQTIDRGYGPSVPRGESLAVSGGVLLVTLLLSCWSRSRSWAVLSGFAFGYLASLVLGQLKLPVTPHGLVLPVPFKFGLSFSWDYVLPFFFLYLITAMETVGDITATAQLSGRPISGPEYGARLKGGVMADSVNSILGGLLGSFPSTTFAQNNGVIQLTSVASRKAGMVLGAGLIFLGLVPAVGNWLAIMPSPVLGGLTLLLFGYVASGGIRILYYSTMTAREWLILSLALGIGIGISHEPDFLAGFPSLLKALVESPIVAGGLAALFLNLILPALAE